MLVPALKVGSSEPGCAVAPSAARRPTGRQADADRTK
jgi:hypothetical protein